MWRASRCASPPLPLPSPYWRWQELIAKRKAKPDYAQMPHLHEVAKLEGLMNQRASDISFTAARSRGELKQAHTITTIESLVRLMEPLFGPQFGSPTKKFKGSPRKKANSSKQFGVDPQVST